MKKLIPSVIVAALAGMVALGAGAASADATLRAGFGARAITPVGASPRGWTFWVNPATGVWSEEFTDTNANNFYDYGEPFIDDVRNTLIDPQSAGKWDGIWTNAGFGGKGALGKLDDTWARAVVVEAGGKKVALVSLDVVGFFNEEIKRAEAELDQAAPGNGIDALIVSSTHTHEGADTMGYWGGIPGIDGKFPLYQKYIRAQIVSAVVEANARLEPARMKAATTVHTTGIRDSRPPQVIDPYVQAIQFLRADDSVIGTAVNWSNHPEALGSSNRYISSDFPAGARDRLEELFGGTAVYFSGSVGGLMTPLRVAIDEEFPRTDDYSHERALHIGKLVADAAAAALADAPIEQPASLDVDHREILLPADNTALRALNEVGVFDKQTYIRGVPAGVFGDQFKTEMYSVGLGSARFLTVPGELFPELELGGYGRPDCAAQGKSADTGRPYEPVITQQYGEQHVFTLGLAQDELGYIVPGYDFWWYGPPAQPDAPQAQSRPVVGGFGVVEAIDPCGEDHYEETVSASSVMAPLVACTAADLAGRDPWENLGVYPACSPENTTITGPMGVRPEALP